MRYLRFASSRLSKGFLISLDLNKVYATTMCAAVLYLFSILSGFNFLSFILFQFVFLLTNIADFAIRVRLVYWYMQIEPNFAFISKETHACRWRYTFYCMKDFIYIFFYFHPAVRYYAQAV